MIITVTLNPAIDKTVRVDRLNVGGLSRVKAVREDAGGKGINVSKTIRSFGGESMAVGLLGGMAGWQIEGTLDKLFIEHEFTHVTGGTRTNLKVVDDDGRVSEINEPGPEITEAELKLFCSRLEEMIKVGDIVVLSGSIPKGVPADFYKKLTTLSREKGAFVFADADGELLREVLYAKPDMIKPNFEELSALMSERNENITGDEKIVNSLPGELDFEDKEMIARAYSMGRTVHDEGIRQVIVSLGNLGAIFITEKGAFYGPSPYVETHSTVGAGDALVAAFAYASEKGWKMEERMRFAIAASAGAVTTEGTSPASMMLINKLLERVEIIPLGV